MKRESELTRRAEQVTRRIAIQAMFGTAMGLAHSLYVRGPGRTLMFALLGISLPTAGEFFVVHVLGILRHKTKPQFKGVPLGAILGWFNIGYASFALMETLLKVDNLSNKRNSIALGAGTAAIATSLDLLLDCASLDEGLWEWTSGGLYAQDISGPNGKAGIPVFNFIGWVLLTSFVVRLYQLLTAGWGGSTVRSITWRQRHLASRWAALLLVPYYFQALAWAIKRRKYRYIAYSLLVPISMLMGWQKIR